MFGLLTPPLMMQVQAQRCTPESWKGAVHGVVTGATILNKSHRRTAEGAAIVGSVGLLLGSIADTQAILPHARVPVVTEKPDVPRRIPNPAALAQVPPPCRNSIRFQMRRARSMPHHSSTLSFHL